MRKTTEEDSTQGALHGVPWVRFSRYEITDDVVHPAADARLELYDPWTEYYDLWRRRGPSLESAEKKRAPRRQQPYDDLLRLGREMEVWPEGGQGGWIPGEVQLTAARREETRAWCCDHGLLGVLHHRARELRLPAQWECYQDEHEARLHAVAHGWKRTPTGWEHVVCNFPAVVETDLAQEGHPVPVARFAELRLPEDAWFSPDAVTYSFPRPIFDLIGPEGGLVSESEMPSQGLVLERFGTGWARHFPTRPAWQSPSWPFPSPFSGEFLHGYGEPLWSIVAAASRLRNVLDLIAYHTPKHRPPTPHDRSVIVAAIANLTAFTGAVSQAPDLDDDGKFQVRVDSWSLLATYGAMIMLDLKGEAPVLTCRRCRRPFIYPDKRAGYCSDRCRQADQKAAYRKKKRSAE